MQSQPHRAFPLSRYFHFDNFSHYYAFGNSPAEDFLQSVSPRECRRPTILSLGCGDMRSVMFTIFKNFGIEGEISDGFKGVRFVLNDRSAAVLARNILFLCLCMNMPDDEVEQKEWIASVWSLWYNHELLPQHDRMLSRALQQLIEWSVTWQEWSNCPLGVVVQFSSPATFVKIKKMWSQWNSHLVKSVDEMKKSRSDYQSHGLEVIYGFSIDRKTGLKHTAAHDYLVVLRSSKFLYSQETINKMENEYLHYLTEGTVWAEYILDIPISNPKTVVNPTLFEREDGIYTLEYSLTPYMGFTPSFQYTHAEVGRTLGKQSPVLQQLPVADIYFESRPLLANSVQQFAMWLEATSKKSSSSNNLSILFDIDDSLNLCCSMLHHPEMYAKFGVQFDAIYTSNLFDHIHPAALVLSALPLLKPTGILFTSTFATSAWENLETVFGFSPELFPVFLGIHCVGYDGDYSSAVKPLPYPFIESNSFCIIFPWRIIKSRPLIFEESLCATKSLLQLCRKSCDIVGESVDSFLCVLNQFLKRFQFPPLPSHPFLKSLCSEIQTSLDLKPHLVQLQTQALLHGMHLHITLTESDCPICKGQPLESYIQQFTVSVDIGDKMGVCDIPSFAVCLINKFYGERNAAITSIAVNYSDSKLQLVFFFPKSGLSQYHMLKVNTFDPTQKCVFLDTIDCLRNSSVEFLFLKEPVPQHTTEVNTLGDIVKHIGDGCTFETVISMNETCRAVEASNLNAICSELNQLKILYGALESNIVYPYAIDESKVSKVHVKKRNTICVTVQRDGTVFYKEKPTYFIDPSNKLVLPRFHCGADVIEKYCKLQVQFNAQDHPLYNAKCCFMELFEEALSGEKYFALSLPSKRFKDAPDMHALVYVHDVRFSPVFASPVLDASYCFLDTKPPHLIRELSVMQNCVGRTCSIMVDEAEYKYLKGVFNFFSTLTQCALSTEKHTVTLPVQKHKLWKHFDQAIMFPLYPNPANPTYQRYVNSSVMEQFPANMSSFHDHLAKLGEGKVNFCSFCGQSSESVTLKKCRRCHKAKYCSEECQRMHWIFHKLVCNVSEQEKAAAKEESNIPQTQPYISLDSSQIASDSSDGKRDHVSNEFESEGFAETAKVTNTCIRCKNPATIIYSCGSVSYCSKACQTLEWPQHSEKCKGQVDDSTSIKTSSSSKNESKPNGADFRSEDTGKSKAASHAGNSGRDKCSRCKNPATIICSCGSVSYCSKACQTLEWPQHSEKCKGRVDDSTSIKTSSSSKNEPKPNGADFRGEDTGKGKAAGNSGRDKCSRCKNPATIICSCGSVSYCSKACQTLEWPQHSEKCKGRVDDSTSIKTSLSSKNEPKPNGADFRSEDTGKGKAAGNSGGDKCSRCKNPATIICSCGSVSYCSKACQTLELPQHSEKCKQPSSDNNSSNRCKDPAAGRKVSADHDDSKREPTTFPTLKCSNCIKMKSSLKCCKCHNVSYCSVECQRLHWPQHKSTCTAVKK